MSEADPAPYQLLAGLAPREYAELKADIARRGILVPVERDESGNILDGHHRVRAWTELRCEGVQVPDYPRIIRSGLSEAEKRNHVRALNLLRRQLTREQRERLIAEMRAEGATLEDIAKVTDIDPSTVKRVLDRSTFASAKVEQIVGEDGKTRPASYAEPEEREERKERVNGLRKNGKTVRQIAKETGLSVGTVHSALADTPRPAGAVIAASAREEALTLAALETVSELPERLAGAGDVCKQARKEEREQRRAEERQRARELSASPFGERLKLHLRTCGELAEVVPAESVDAIITDPPYLEEFLPAYTDLAHFAAHALKPGGSLLVMCGQYHLRDMLRRLSECLEYRWVIAYLVPGGENVQVWSRKVNTFWKPVLWFTRGAYAGDWQGDVVQSIVTPALKEFHSWGQTEAGISNLVDRWSKPGDVVCDPFLGGGTTGLVALRLGRSFIGADHDENALLTAQARILEGSPDAER